MDQRISLIDIQQSKLLLNAVYEIDFGEPVGRGGTCLVYHAYKLVEADGKIYKHKVILKEFYPTLSEDWEPIQRKSDGSLEVPGEVSAESSYLCKLNRFKKSYELFLNFHNEKQTNHFVIDADELLQGNGTWYLVVDYNNARSLADYCKQKPGLYDFCCIMRCAAEAVLRIHEEGWLHLDLTPGNLLVFGIGAVRIMDTDSMLLKADICREKPVLSWSAGYSAPELNRTFAYQFLSQYGEKADIYSLGAIFHAYLMDKQPDASAGPFDEARMQEKIEEKYARSVKGVSCCSRTAKLLLCNLLRRMIARNTSERYGSMQEVIDALDELIPYTRPERIHILERFIPNTGQVYGFEQKLAEMEAYFHAVNGQHNTGAHILCISGIGGMGKSTLAREYARVHASDYEAIVEVTADCAQEVIRKIYLVNYDARQRKEESFPKQYAEKDEGEFAERFSVLKKLSQETKILLLVHDYNQRKDAAFGLFRELRADIILTSWADWRDSGIHCIILNRNTLSEAAALSIFQNAYCHNAIQERDVAWLARLEQILAREEKSLKMLLQKIEHHPLTIKLLGMQMAYESGNEQTPAEMLKELEIQGLRADEWVELPNSKDGKGVDMGDACYHLGKLFDSVLRQGALKAEELEVLRYMTLLSTEQGVSKELFSKWTGLGEKGSKLLVSLTKKGWLEYYSQGRDELINMFTAVGTYSMPMIIAEMLYRRKELQSTVSNSKVLIESFIAAEQEGNDWLYGRNILWRLAQNFLKRIEYKSLTSQKDLLYACGHSLYRWLLDKEGNKDMITQAEQCFALSLELRRQEGNEYDPYIAFTYGYLAILNLWKCTSEALTVAMEYEVLAEDILEQMPEKRTRIQSLVTLGRIYRQRPGLALPLLQQAVEEMEQLSDFPMEERGKVYKEIGRAYFRRSEEKNGILYLEKAINCYKSLYGEEHREVWYLHNMLKMLRGDSI